MGLHLIKLVCLWFAFPGFPPQNTEPNNVCLIPGSACQGPFWMVRGPEHGPPVDVVEIAATPWAPVLVALSIFEELLLAVPHSRRDGSVVSSRDERQPSQNGGNRHNVDLRLRLWLIQQLSPALACLAPPRGDTPVKNAYNVKLRSTRSSNLILKLLVTIPRSHTGSRSWCSRIP